MIHQLRKSRTLNDIITAMDKTAQKFTKLEIAIFAAGILILGIIIWNEKNTLEAQHRDSARKVAINAIHANLEEVTFRSLQGYPESLETKHMTAIDASLLEDPHGVRINTLNSEYSYEPSNCQQGVCKHYQLRAILEKEAPFIQKSLR